MELQRRIGGAPETPRAWNLGCEHRLDLAWPHVPDVDDEHFPGWFKAFQVGVEHPRIVGRGQVAHGAQVHRRFAQSVLPRVDDHALVSARVADHEPVDGLLHLVEQRPLVFDQPVAPVLGKASQVPAGNEVESP